MLLGSEGTFSMWASAELYYQNSRQSHFSGVYLLFEVFQDTWRPHKQNPRVDWHATLSCPLMASDDANSYLFPISFWMVLQACISFLRRLSKVAHFCSCLVRIRMPLLMCRSGVEQNPMKNLGNPNLLK